MLDRIIGILTLKAPVYKAVAQDTSATQQAGIIVLIASILSGIGNSLIGNQMASMIPGAAAVSAQRPGLIPSIILSAIAGLVGWFVGSWLLAFVAKTFFKGETNTGEMLRVSGFTHAFGVLSIVPCLGIVAAIASIVGNIIGIREAAGFDTTKAILSAIIAGVIAFVVVAVVGGVIGGLLGVGGAMMPLPAGG